MYNYPNLNTCSASLNTCSGSFNACSCSVNTVRCQAWLVQRHCGQDNCPHAGKHGTICARHRHEDKSSWRLHELGVSWSGLPYHASGYPWHKSYLAGLESECVSRLIFSEILDFGWFGGVNFGDFWDQSWLTKQAVKNRAAANPD